MGSSIDCWIEYDQHGDPPFSVMPECLPLAQWLDLGGAKDYRVYGALSGVRNDTGIDPLFPLRGLPSTPSAEVDKAFGGDGAGVGWLYPEEVTQALSHHQVTEHEMSIEMQCVLHAIEFFAAKLGKERVRFVFDIE